MGLVDVTRGKTGYVGALLVPFQTNEALWFWPTRSSGRSVQGFYMCWFRRCHQHRFQATFTKVFVQLVRLYWLDVFLCWGLFGAYILVSGVYGWWEECYIWQFSRYVFKITDSGGDEGFRPATTGRLPEKQIIMSY